MASLVRQKTLKMFAIFAVVALVVCAYLIGEQNGKAGRSVDVIGAAQASD